MDLGGDIPITLIVKAPNQRIADLPVECMMGWTIRKLKQHLEDVYPSKPKHSQQKLIYSGKLLPDHLTLKEVLRQGDEEASHHTLHLVCAPTSEGFGPSMPSSPAPSSQSSSSAHPTNTPAASANGTPSPTTSQPPHAYAHQGLRYRGNGMPQAQNAAVPPLMAMPTMAGYPYGAYHPQQYAYMQQMYAQYMAQYLQHYQMTAAVAPAAAAAAAAELPNVQAPAPAPAANANMAAPANQNMRMNAQGGMVDDDDEDEMNRDWLDYVYMSFRFLVLLSILYFYSNFSRFMAVFMGCIMVYILQRVWPQMRGANQAVRQEERNAANQQAPNEDNAPPDAAWNDDANPQAAASQSAEATEDADTDAERRTGGQEEPQQQEQQQQQPPPTPHPLSVAYTFVTTFFTSLIPQQPEAVNLN